MATIKITDDRQGNSFRTGVNGRQFDLPVNQELEVADELVEHLQGIGARFDEVDAKRAGSSKDGSSGDGLARNLAGRSGVIMAGTQPKSLNDRPLAGDQPGDVTLGASGAGQSGGNEKVIGGNIKDDAEVSNIRVAAERRANDDTSPAELAGEGEQGTKKSDPQPVKPTHKDEDSKSSTKAKK